jgi:hypothetical protein
LNRKKKAAAALHMVGYVAVMEIVLNAVMET